MSTILLSGAQRVVGAADAWIVGGMVSATVTPAAHEAEFPLSSRAVVVTARVPRPKNDGASFESVTDASHTSDAVAPARNEASCRSPAWTPLSPVHSTVTCAGHETLGAAVSITVTACDVDAALCASSRAVHTTVCLPSGSVVGASLVTWGAGSHVSLVTGEPMPDFGYPAGDVHSKVRAAGAAIAGAAVSRTVTSCVAVPTFDATSRAVHVTVVAPPGKRTGASFV